MMGPVVKGNGEASVRLAAGTDGSNTVDSTQNMPRLVSGSDRVESVSAGRMKNEDKILETIRQHLREAWRNRAVGKLTFELEFNLGSIRKRHIGVQVNYRFLENEDAL